MTHFSEIYLVCVLLVLLILFIALIIKAFIEDIIDSLWFKNKMNERKESKRTKCALEEMDKFHQFVEDLERFHALNENVDKEEKE